MAIDTATVPLGLISLDYGSWRQVVEGAAAWRLPLVELFLDVSFREADLTHIERRLDQGDVRVSSVSSLARLALVEEDLAETQRLVDRCIRVAATLGAPFVTLMHGGCATLDAGGALDRLRERLVPLARTAAKHEVTLLIENVFSRQAPDDLASVEATIDAFECLKDLGIGLNLDLGNYAVAGEEAVPLAWEALQPYVRSLHLKNVVPHRLSTHVGLGQRRELKDAERGVHVSVPLSDGIVNYVPVMRDLASGRFSGPVMLEPFANGAHRDAWIARSIADLTTYGVVTTIPTARGLR